VGGAGGKEMLSSIALELVARSDTEEELCAKYKFVRWYRQAFELCFALLPFSWLQASVWGRQRVASFYLVCESLAHSEVFLATPIVQGDPPKNVTHKIFYKLSDTHAIIRYLVNMNVSAWRMGSPSFRPDNQGSCFYDLYKMCFRCAPSWWQAHLQMTSKLPITRTHSSFAIAQLGCNFSLQFKVVPWSLNFFTHLGTSLLSG